MNNSTLSIWKASMNYGAIYGAAFIVTDLIFYWANAPFSSVYMLVRPIILIAGLYITSRHMRNNFILGFVSYGKMFSISVRISFFAAVLFGFYKFIFCTYINPNYIYEYFQTSGEILANSGLPEAFADQMLDELAKEQDKATPLSLAKSELFAKFFWGTVVALFTSIFLNKPTPKNPFSQGTSYFTDNQ